MSSYIHLHYPRMRLLSSVSVTLCCEPYRIGPREKYFHCEKCNLCLAQDLRGNHKVIITLHLFLTHTYYKYCVWWANEYPHCCHLQSYFYVSVCWKRVKAELPSVYGGNETYIALGDKGYWILLQSFTLSTIWYDFLLYAQDIHTSRIGAHVLPCGHLLHKYDSLFSKY